MALLHRPLVASQWRPKHVSGRGYGLSLPRHIPPEPAGVEVLPFRWPPWIQPKCCKGPAGFGRRDSRVPMCKRASEGGFSWKERWQWPEQASFCILSGGTRALPSHTPGSSPAKEADVWAQEGAQMTSVTAVPHSDPADKAKKLAEEACFHGPTKLKVSMSLRKHRTSSGQTPSKTS